jgi:hypothetical protein
VCDFREAWETKCFSRQGLKTKRNQEGLWPFIYLYPPIQREFGAARFGLEVQGKQETCQYKSGNKSSLRRLAHLKNNKDQAGDNLSPLPQTTSNKPLELLT